MITGCGSGSAAVTSAVPPFTTVVDHASVRCPRVDPRQRAVLKRRVSAPKADHSDGVTKAALLAKIDELRRSDDAKGRTGLAIADELDRCAAGAAVTSASPTGG